MKKTRERATNDKKEKTESMIFRLSPELKKDYMEFCEKNGYAYGKRLRTLIKRELGNE